MALPTIKALRGFLIDAPSPGKLRAVRDGAILIESGKILDAGEFERISNLPEAQGVIWQHSPECILIPGLIDTHTHLPQYPAVGREEPALLPWLERHIFPLERNFTPKVAAEQAPAFFQELARQGTTCASIYTTIFEDSCNACFEAAESFGIRAILGKVMMDRLTYGSLPTDKILSISLEETRRLAKKWHGFDGGRLEYAVSPRFAISCTAELMRGAADIAREVGCYVQTHLSENPDEVRQVRELFPNSPSYTAVYDECGLLTEKTILGHCVHLSDAEIGLLAERGSIVAHCPTANLFLRSGLLPYAKLKATGVRLTLGTDVAAGSDLNLWRVMRSAIETQIARSFSDPDTVIPSSSEVFYHATLGAATALGKSHLLGTFDPGKEADFVVLDLAAIHPRGRHPNLNADLTAEQILSLFVYRGGPEATRETWVCGRPIYTAPPPALL